MNPQNIYKNTSVIVCLCFLLCISFGLDERMVNGLISGKMLWLCGWGIALAFFYLSIELMERRSCLKLKLADLMVFLLLGNVLLTYNWEVNPNLNALLFTVQISLLWFIFRFVYSKAPAVDAFIIPFLLFTGTIQAVWGLVQIYDLADSNHALFQLTGFFPNPGPYSGYLAVILSTATGYMLHVRKHRRSTNYDYRLVYYLSLITILLIIMVLPAGMSRSAWLAAILPCGWVVWKYKLGIRKFRMYLKRKTFLLLTIITLSVILLTGTLGALYHLKKDSADGRLLMWKITTEAFLENPVKGTGIGGFPAAFAKAQANYLSSNEATIQEKRIAGTPTAAFNEYLQILTELGIFGFLFFIGLIATVIYTGIRKKRYYAVAGIFSLLIFAFSSYPLRDPSFWPMLLILCITAIRDTRVKNCQRLLPYVGILIAIVFIGISSYLGYRLIHYAKWTDAKVLYTNKAYEMAIDKYAPLYPYLDHDPGYLFEYAQCLGECNRPEEAIQYLERASKVSSDPMIICMIGKNKMKCGQFREAEACYQEALRILPERIYPYYLMTELYSHPDNYQEEKLKTAADSVFYKRPKVENTAIREMREKVNKLLRKKEFKQNASD